MDIHKTPQTSRYRISKTTAKSDGPQPWTASRCHRLLRPLLSRLALLRKELTALPEPTVVDLPAAATTTKARRKSGKRQSTDSQWMLPRKKMRHTYSQKMAERQVPVSSETQPLSIKLRAAKELQGADDHLPAHGDAVAFTPLVRRARGQDVPSPANVSKFGSSQGLNSSQTRRKKTGASRRSELEERLARLKNHVSPSRYSDYESVFRSLEALLKGTAQEEEKTKGASSLLDMCLKKMPWYIAGVQAWELDEAEKSGTKSAFNSSDTSLRLYNELETLGPSQHGWSHLRTVARADGVAAVREAMLEGLLNDDFCLLVIDLCTEYEATTEAETLIEVFIQRQYPSPSGPGATFTENDALRPLAFLWDFSIGLARHSFLLRQYTMLLAGGFLPVEWLVTEGFERVWALAHRVLSRGSKALAAIDFLITAIISLCRRHRVNQKSEVEPSVRELESQILPTLSRSLAILSAMNAVGEMEARVNELQPVGSQTIAFISQNITYTFFGCLMEVEGRKRRSSNMARDLLYLAAFLASSSSLRTDRVHSRLTDAFALSLGVSVTGKVEVAHDSDQHYSGMISLISQIAQICGRGSSEAPYQHLERLCRDLQLLGLEEHMLSSIMRAGALFLAQQTSNLRDLVYAESLASHQAQTLDEGHKRATDLLLGYRWEETIGEWVTVSPVAQRKQPAHRRSSRFQESRAAPKEEHTTTVVTSRDTGPTGQAAPDLLTELVPHSFTNLEEEEEEEEEEANHGKRGKRPGVESGRRRLDAESQRRHHHTHQSKQCNNLLKPTTSNNRRRCSIRSMATISVMGSSRDDELDVGSDDEEKENIIAHTAAASAAAVRSKAKTAHHRYGTGSRSSSSSSSRRPLLGERRRIRLSGDLLLIHSDDELGI